jgi:general L-amino acid transport system substrate-binding protein
MPRHAGILVALAAVLLSGAASATTLDTVRTRGTLRCGVSEGITGFSSRDAQGRWSGLDVDFCRAVAAAVLGDAERTTFVPLRASERFPALRLAQIDLLARNTTWTLSREAGLGVLFAGVLLYDGQGFLVAAQPPTDSAAHLSGAVCVEKATTHVEQLEDWAHGHGAQVTPLVLDSAPQAAAAFLAGRCVAYSSDVSTLAAARAAAPNPAAFTILADRISKEPLGPVVRAGDDQWFTLVRWVLFALIAAEEADLTRATVATLHDRPDPAIGRVLGADRELARLLGVPPEWSIRAVAAGGNYGELFERNLGRDSPLALERGLNRLWNRGGILFAPPLR